ncbi:MAG: periplasmic heavy metal sensor [Deltaproteobacteria bacterium]|nr:periplasmic heavy metal sensor [Deltaproteobacteria bacterium]
MKQNFTNKVFMALIIVVLVVGMNAYVTHAHGPGGGYQGNYTMMGGRGHYGSGLQSGGYGHMMGNFTNGENRWIDEQRNAFFKSTEDLGQKVYEKELALQSEFAKEKIDPRKTENLQKEIYRLRTQIDQKRSDNMVEMRKIHPGAERGFMDSGGMGYGSGTGNYCWR